MSQFSFRSRIFYLDEVCKEKSVEGAIYTFG